MYVLCNKNKQKTRFLDEFSYSFNTYAVDSTPFIVENNIGNALFNWFKNNLLKCNLGKFHVLFSTNQPVGIKTRDYTIDKSECVKLLDVRTLIKSLIKYLRETLVFMWSTGKFHLLFFCSFFLLLTKFLF